MALYQIATTKTSIESKDIVLTRYNQILLLNYCELKIL